MTGFSKQTGFASRQLELMLFEHDPILVRRALDFGINTFLIDWESRGKQERQTNLDTEINPATLDNLQKVCAIPGTKAWCRVNGWGPWSPDEVEAAVAVGAYGLFLPMVRRVEEVELFINAIGGRCEAAILIETPEAVELAADLARLPLNRVYFGLNDFAICRGRQFIFDALHEGIVGQVRSQLGGIPFGFGGATAVGLGAPLPCHMLLAEMARLDCQFTFLRRSFKKDIATRDPVTVVSGIHDYWRDLHKRPLGLVESEFQQLLTALEPLCA